MGKIRRFKLDPKNLPKDVTDWERVRKMTDAEVLRAARSDPDAQPLTARQLKQMMRVPDVRRVRRKLGMSQAGFARAFWLSLGTVRDWEQGRFSPEAPARVLLAVIEHEPAAVRRALKASEGKQGRAGGHAHSD
ncbi:MAG: helix-turn-helix domain-containing protein [Rhodospirillales bacterium]|nr:helix-turn-helix domain-containing protein [Rhodospirillales bacterium]